MRVLKQPAAGDELALNWVEFKPNSAINLSRHQKRRLKRLSRLVKANPQLKFEIQVMLMVMSRIQFSPILI